MKKKLLIAALILLLVPVVIYFSFPGILYNYSITSAIKAAGLSKKIAVDNYFIHYLEGGQGETILLLHGFGADKDSWPRFTESLTENYHVVAVVLPGFGENSKKETDSYSIADQVKRVNRIVETLELKKFHIGGNSMGGAISGKYTVEYPDKVLSLALLNTAGIYSAKKVNLWSLWKKGTTLFW